MTDPVTESKGGMVPRMVGAAFLDIGNGKTFLTILVSGGVYAFLQTFLFLPF